MSPAELNLLMQMERALNIQGRQQKRGKEGLLSALPPCLLLTGLPPLPSCSFPFLLSPTFISKSLSPAPHDAVVRPDESFQLVYCLCHPLNGELGPLPRSVRCPPPLPPRGAAGRLLPSLPLRSPFKPSKTSDENSAAAIDLNPQSTTTVFESGAEGEE